MWQVHIPNHSETSVCRLLRRIAPDNKVESEIDERNDGIMEFFKCLKCTQMPQIKKKVILDIFLRHLRHFYFEALRELNIPTFQLINNKT